MSVRREFNEWAEQGRDQGMETRHWHTARHALARMPIESGDIVLDLGCGSGYALRALRGTKHVDRAYGLDGSPAMVRNARSYTDDPNVGYVVGDFQSLPFKADSIDHVFSMEAFYYAADPVAALREVRRVTRSGGTFYCAVNFFEENVYSHEWQDQISIDMTLWSAEQYREGFKTAGFYVASQDNIPDRDTEIPPAEVFPTDEWETREEMVERYREYGTLLTVGIVP